MNISCLTTICGEHPQAQDDQYAVYRSLSNTPYYPRAHGIKTGYTSQAAAASFPEATGDGLDLLGIVLRRSHDGA